MTSQDPIATLLKQGAEARVYRLPFINGQDCIVKERLKKHYRHPVLDEKLTHRRVIQEARAMRNCKKAGIDTPTVYLIDTVNSSIYMEYIDGPSLRDYIMNAAGTMAAENESELARQFGGVLAALHSIDLIHGDLTTSNVLVRKDSLCLVLIDFGLSQKSTLAEDKAVDLYVLERAFLSTHPGTEALFSNILVEYERQYKQSSSVMKKLDEVRRRGRKRTAFG